MDNEPTALADLYNETQVALVLRALYRRAQDYRLKLEIFKAQRIEKVVEDVLRALKEYGGANTQVGAMLAGLCYQTHTCARKGDREEAERVSKITDGLWEALREYERKL